MPHKEKRRKIATPDALASSMGPRRAVDFFVPLPDPSTCRTFTSTQTMTAVLHNLKKSGYIKCALTHTVYGRPKDPDDLATNAIPKSLLSSSPIPILRRLHVIVESLADVGLFSSAAQSPISNILNGYDLISLAPRNTATVDAACRAQVDIISIDYHSMSQLAFRWKRQDIRQLIQQNTLLEIPYAPALLDAKARRNWMTICNDAVTTAPNILLSSGPRIVKDEDVGPQALRMPGDVLNFAHVIMGLSAKTVHGAMDEEILNRIKSEKALCHMKVSKVEIEETSNTIAGEEKRNVDPNESTEEVGDTALASRNMNDVEDGDDDGYIAL